jgi:hypothetical protein
VLQGKYRFFLLLCWLLPALAQAQDRAQIRLDSNVAETGVPFTLHFSVEAGENKLQALNLSAWAPDITEKNVLSEPAWTQHGATWTSDLQLMFFDADTLDLAPLPVISQRGDTLYTQPIQLLILPTPAPDDLNDMADIKDIYREPAHWTDYWPWMAGGAAILLLLGAMQWLASRKGKKQAGSRRMELPPRELAMRKLAALEKEKLPEKGEIKMFYAELTHILREFIQLRFQVPALESTSYETVQHLRTVTAFPIQRLHFLNELLQHADMVKFAKGTPPESYTQSALGLVRQIIQEIPEGAPSEPSQEN